MRTKLHPLLAAAAASVSVVVIASVIGAPQSAAQVRQSVVVNPNPANFPPTVNDGTVRSVVQVGNTVILGGSFTSVTPTGSSKALTKKYTVAFDATTGQINNSFSLTVNAPIESMVPADDGASFYVAGGFNILNGVKTRIGRVNASTGAIVSEFRPPMAGAVVKDVTFVTGRLFVAGSFKTMGVVPRAYIAELNPTTGALLGSLNLAITGAHNGGLTNVFKAKPSPDGRRMVIIGNFTVVQGQAREQIAMLDLTGDSVTLSNWYTARYQIKCNPAWQAYVRDVDYSPDGSYFVVASAGGHRPPLGLCDAAARFETNASGLNLAPTWVDHSGGDSLTAVAVTGAAVYVGGHQRWMNNSSATNQAGPGSVAREGIAALEPLSGLPLTWNPGRTRGVGVDVLYATSSGLWLGSDTSRVGGEQRGKAAFFPVSGGTAAAAAVTGRLPGRIVLAGRTTGEDTVRTIDFNGAAPTGSGTVASSVAWHSARGAFMIDSTLYTGWSDGQLYLRSFNGTSFGAPTSVDTNGINLSTTFSGATGMFWREGRLYYTRAKSNKLFFRNFAKESAIIGVQEFVASPGVLTNLDWRKVSGMFSHNAYLYVSMSDTGQLKRVTLSETGVPVNGTVTTLSGPTIDGTDWRGRAIFLESN